MGVPALDMIHEYDFEKLISKCGKYICRIIYKERNQQLYFSLIRKLPSYIATYCFNVTSLDLTASIVLPREVEILAENCKKIKELRLRLHWGVLYEEQLTKLFEVNKNLEDIALYNREFLCPSLMKLPEHKMKAIKLESDIYFSNNIFSSVSIEFFLYLFLIIGILYSYRS